MQAEIDYVRLGVAREHYHHHGYKYIEVPWWIQPETIRATLPSFAHELRVWSHSYDGSLNAYEGSLVASGEQSFLQMWARRELPPGRYQCITPCFRKEPVVDELHRLWFLKLELIDTEQPNVVFGVAKMVEAARDFFSRFLTCKVVSLPDGTFDLESDEGVEIGSYGVRQWKGPDGAVLHWAYGTGCAEPRTSSAIRIQRNERDRIYQEIARGVENLKKSDGSGE